MFDLIEHIDKEKIIDLLATIHNVLNKNGILIIRTPNIASIVGIRIRYADFTHTIGFTTESMRQVLFEAGFRDVKFKNLPIGRKRIFLLNLVESAICWMNGVRKSEIVTFNLMSIAKRIT